jgi:hypothetical protein
MDGIYLNKGLVPVLEDLPFNLRGLVQIWLEVSVNQPQTASPGYYASQCVFIGPKQDGLWACFLCDFLAKVPFLW